MLITVDVKAFYEWEPMDKVPSASDILAKRAKPADNGKWLRKTVKHQPTYTQISLPEAEIKNAIEHSERIGMPKSRERVVVWLLEEMVMPHHAHPDHWLKISVHDEPVLESFLNQFFSLPR